MRLVILLILASALLGCYKEDERASDFALTHELKDERWKSQWVEGHLKNNSPTPANKVKIQMKMYTGRVLANTQYFRIKEELFMGDSAHFCETVGDTISHVELTIVLVE